MELGAAIPVMYVIALVFEFPSWYVAWVIKYRNSGTVNFTPPAVTELGSLPLFA